MNGVNAIKMHKNIFRQRNQHRGRNAWTGVVDSASKLLPIAITKIFQLIHRKNKISTQHNHRFTHQLLDFVNDLSLVLPVADVQRASCQNVGDVVHQRFQIAFDAKAALEVAVATIVLLAKLITHFSFEVVLRQSRCQKRGVQVTAHHLLSS
jgi:hypothetical protein